MEENLNNKKFLRFARAKIVNMINEIYGLESTVEEYNLKANELKIFYFSLIENRYISNNNKFLLCRLFHETNNGYIKNWIFDFLTISILKLYEVEVNQNSLANNFYFSFKFLANKEKLRDFLYKYNILAEIDFAKGKNFLKENDLNNHVYDIMNILNQIKIDFNISEITDMSNLIIYYVNLQKRILNNDDNIVIIADKYFFELKNGNLVFSDFFAVFIDFIFNIKSRKNYNLNLNYNTFEEIKNEITKAFV